MIRKLSIVILCVLIGCSEVSDMTGGGFDGQQADVKYLQYGKQFGYLLMEKDFKTAYKMTSSHLQQSMTYDGFVAAYEKAVKEYGEPKKVETDIDTVDPEILADEDLGFPQSISGSMRRARVAVMFPTEIDEQGDAFAGFTCWINIVEENGQDRLCTMEYELTD